MKLNEAIELLEVVDDKEIVSEIQRLLGLFEIEYQKVERERKQRETGTAQGWRQARIFLNQLAKKEYRGIKPFLK